MSVYASNTWGSTDSNDRACIGLWFYEESNTATSYKFRADAWIWTKWAIHDSDNEWYWDIKRGSAPAATTKYSSRDIYTTVSSGSGWSESNQQKIDSGTYTYTKEHSAYYVYIRIWLDDVATTGSYMAHNGWVQIPAKTSYTITYDANGGSGAPGKGTKWYGEAYTVSSTIPTRTGYNFVNWTITSTGTKVSAGGTISAGSNANYTLKANWTPITYAVNYYGNGGNLPTSGFTNPQSKIYGTTLKLNTGVPTYSGYIFNGWNTNNLGTGTNYSAGANYTTNDNLKLYAKWNYTITYNANQGSNPPSTQTVKKGTSTTISTIKPTRSGFTFNGWNTNSSGTGGTNYNPGNSYNGSSITLYAKWLQNYTVSYNANNGTGAPDNQTKISGTALTLSNNTPVRENYTFLGWLSSSDSQIYYPGDSYEYENDTIMTAQWQENYIRPSISNIIAQRADSNGILRDEGEYAKISFNWSVDTNLYTDNVGTLA